MIVVGTQPRGGKAMSCTLAHLIPQIAFLTEVPAG